MTDRIEGTIDNPRPSGWHYAQTMMKLAKRKGEVVEMIDGRCYFSMDNWQTAAVVDRDGGCRKLKGDDLNLARFLAASQSSWAGNAS